VTRVHRKTHDQNRKARFGGLFLCVAGIVSGEPLASFGMLLVGVDASSNEKHFQSVTRLPVVAVAVMSVENHGDEDA